MYPPLWFWAPTFYFPFSGSVAQTIEPDLFDNIDSNAGNGKIERQACKVASYGRQLGLITEILLDIAKDPETLALASPKAKESVQRLEIIQATIEQIKAEAPSSIGTEIDACLSQMKTRDPEAFSKLHEQLLDIVMESNQRCTPPVKARLPAPQK